MTNGKRTLARRKRIYTAQQEQNLGYRVHWKRFYIAYFIEAAIVGASVFAGWQFANRYAGDEPAAAAPMQVAALGSWIMPTMHQSDAWKMAIIATLAIAAAELARLPLVQGFRTQRSKIMRGFLLLGVLMMCVVTTKSMSQVMEQMFHPRLRFVQTASADLKIAQAEYGKIDAQRGGAQANAKPLTELLERLDAQIADLNKSLQGLGPQPAQRKVIVRVKRRNGKKVWYENLTTYKDVPWSGKALVDQINDARAKRQQAAERQNDAGMTVVNFDQQIAEQRNLVTVKENALRDAVNNSQLHSFTAMVFGKDPVEVTDGEVHWFLRFFVLIPALMIALASSLLMMSAYERITPKRRPEEKFNLDINTDGTLAAFVRSTASQVLKGKN